MSGMLPVIWINIKIAFRDQKTRNKSSDLGIFNVFWLNTASAVDTPSNVYRPKPNGIKTREVNTKNNMEMKPGLNFNNTNSEKTPIINLIKTVNNECSYNVEESIKRVHKKRKIEKRDRLFIGKGKTRFARNKKE